jgi:hypothetical protein
LVVDLRRGWRLTNPNLEQLQLLEVDYAELVNCVEDQADWADQRHPLLAQASIERFLICHRLLEELRERLAIETMPFAGRVRAAQAPCRRSGGGVGDRATRSRTGPQRGV